MDNFDRDCVSKNRPVRIRTVSQHRQPHRRNTRDGATTVEFVLVFPLILLFFITLMAFTQAFMLRDTAQHAAYKGARRGMVWNSTTEQVGQEVATFLSRLGVRDAVVTIDPPVLNNSVTAVTVTVAIPMNRNAWVASPLMPDSFAPNAAITLNRPR